MAHLYSLYDFYIPYGNLNFILVLVLKFPGSLNLHFTIYQITRKSPSLTQSIPRIYKKNYYKNSKIFLGRYKNIRGNDSARVRFLRWTLSLKWNRDVMKSSIGLNQKPSYIRYRASSIAHLRYIVCWSGKTLHRSTWSIRNIF